MSEVPARTLPELLERLLAYGDHPFLCHGELVLTAAQVVARAHEFAQELLALGVEPGDRVAIYLEKRVEKALLVFACGLAGALSVIVNPRLKDAQLAHVLGDADVRLVVTSADKELFLADSGRTLAGRQVVRVDALGAARSPRRNLPSVSAATPATILYTSGSTGLPKGIVQSHGTLCDGARIVAGYLGLCAQDHILAVLPLSFDYGLNQVLSAAWAGARVTLLGFLSIGEVLITLERHGCTGLAGVPSFWVAFCAAVGEGTFDPARLRALRYVTNSGGRLGREEIRTLRERLPEVLVFSMYGLTEAFRSSYLPPAEIDRIPGSIGKAIPEVELLVVDPLSGKECEPGEVGELVHAGALVADGYWRRPDDTARVFRPDPRGDRPGRVVYSGDLMRKDAQAHLWFVGRHDRQLKIQGYRVSPEEVERELEHCHGVAKACVFGVRDRALGTRLVAGVQPTGTATAGLVAAILRRMRSVVPAWLVPSEVHVVAALPLNQNGKPDARALQHGLGMDEDEEADATP